LLIVTITVIGYVVVEACGLAGPVDPPGTELPGLCPDFGGHGLFFRKGYGKHGAPDPDGNRPSGEVQAERKAEVQRQRDEDHATNKKVAEGWLEARNKPEVTGDGDGAGNPSPVTPPDLDQLTEELSR
jgi:hypothetical protein